MRAKFVGEGRDDPAGVILGGVYFPAGVAVEIPAGWEAKVRGNGHFEIVKGRPPKSPPKVTADDENGG